MPTLNLIVKCTDAGGVGSDLYTASVTSGQLITISESISANQTNLAIACAFDVSKLKAFFIVSDENCTLETNSGSSPADTFALEADVPILWNEDMPITNPFGTNVTGLYVTNTTACTFKAWFLVDPT